MTTDLYYKGCVENEQGTVYEFETDDYKGNQEEYTGPIKEAPQEPEPSEDAVTQLLNEEREEEAFDLIPKDIIYHLKGEFWDSWDKVKGHWHNIIKPSSETTIAEDKSPKIDKWFFLIHGNDSIEGKPQLVHDVMKRILLIRLTSKIHSEGRGKDKEVWKTPKYIFVDERYDKRYDGAMIDSFSKDFWIYKIKDKGKEYYIYSENKLPEGKCSLKGMIVDLADVSEMSNTLKVNSLSPLFFVQSAEPATKTLPKEELIEFVKSKELNLNIFLNHLSQHPFGTINRYPTEVELLKSSLLLSGKVDGWPAHLAIMGPQGTRKTMGHAETTYSKFDEDVKLASATNYRLKGLIPSFKKVPAEPGYILNCHRIAIIDEISKLIDMEANRHDRQAMNIMGEFNDILEHKQRSGGSGNDFIDIDPTAKVWLITNPCSRRETIYQHVGLIDPTVMGRMLWWVQDEDEQEFVLSSEGLIRNPPTPLQDLKSSPDTYSSILQKLLDVENRKNSIVLGNCRGELIGKEDFLTIYDSCQKILSEIDDNEVQKLVDEVTALAKQPMKDVWKPRAFHHVKLLIDGLCKMRCLFESRDSTFAAKQEDYGLAERILVRMVKSWDTNLQPKEDF